ncbi:MAG TPA: phosphatase PAP2 family protein [Euryarchaeota archaeon]|nr:phosphatase PAP2 family protein [Euryarchaeota archaeon]
MFDFLLISSILLAVPPAYFFYLFFRGNRRKALTLLSAYLFLTAVVLLLKFMLKVPRPENAGTVDPYSFPSYHSAYASLLFFITPNIYTLLYAVLMGYLRVLAGVHTWADVFGGYVLSGLLWWVYRKGRERVGFEWDRQAFHMGTGSLLGLILYVDWKFGLLLMFFLLLLGIFLYRWRKHPWISAFLEFFDRDGTGKGAFSFIVGAIAAVIINPALGWAAVWYLSYVDAVATIVGKYFATRGKSAVGTLAGLVAGVLVAFATDTPLWFAPVVAAVEYLSPFDDNVVIPVVVSVLGLL